MADKKAISSATTFEMQTFVATNIKAPADKILRLLTEAKNFTKWNSTQVSLQGEMKQGESTRLVYKVDPKQTFNLKVAEKTSIPIVVKDFFATLFTSVRIFKL
ncbi:MAG: hypothetical protein WBB21_05335 [Saprospiraceae bacterium]